ncbi:MAG: radical SAM protein [Nanoarchaeota archaeon]|nr:radical SAM protein [Nanoarchaeota archaeon]
MKLYIDCVGCEQRQLDTQRIMNYSQRNRIDLVNSPSISDYAIIVTCAVDSSTEKASLSKIKQISRELSGKGKLIIGGCLPSISPKELTQYDVYHTFSPRNMKTLDSIFQSKYPMSSIKIPSRSVFDSKRKYGEGLTFKEEYDSAKHGFKVVINQGCLGSCSYCAIRYATGKLASRPLEDVVEQVKDGITQGEETVMLMGGDTGAYGRDIGIKFPALLKELISLHEYKLYIHDFGVNWLIRDFEEHLEVLEQNKNNPRIRVINFPIQSGSDRVLKLMRRAYKSDEVRRTLTKVKDSYPSLGIGTHVIIGFPSETETDFISTLRLLENIDFDFITCFPYSEHELTDSASIPDKIGDDTIEKRLEKISETLGNKVKIIR